MSARIINLHTGDITPLVAVWHERDQPDIYHCEDCGEELTEEEVDRLSADDTPRWTCDPCSELHWMDLWLDRSYEAQDRAVMRGMG